VAFPAEVEDVVDERSGKRLGSGRTFPLEYNTVEALFLSFRGPPPHGKGG
jgi:hypothetical protein